MVQSVCGSQARTDNENNFGNDAAMDQFNEILHIAAKIDPKNLKEIASFASPPADVVAICQIMHCLKTN